MRTPACGASRGSGARCNGRVLAPSERALLCASASALLTPAALRKPVVAEPPVNRPVLLPSSLVHEETLLFFLSLLLLPVLLPLPVLPLLFLFFFFFLPLLFFLLDVPELFFRFLWRFGGSSSAAGAASTRVVVEAEGASGGLPFACVRARRRLEWCRCSVRLLSSEARMRQQQRHTHFGGHSLALLALEVPGER